MTSLNQFFSSLIVAALSRKFKCSLVEPTRVIFAVSASRRSASLRWLTRQCFCMITMSTCTPTFTSKESKSTRKSSKKLQTFEEIESYFVITVGNIFSFTIIGVNNFKLLQFIIYVQFFNLIYKIKKYSQCTIDCFSDRGLVIRRNCRRALNRNCCHQFTGMGAWLEWQYHSRATVLIKTTENDVVD